MKINSKDIILVSIQLVLFILYTFPVAWSLEFFSWFKNVGLMLTFIGSIVLALALLQLNKNLSPFPTPKDSAVLLQNGLYAWVRHPIYSGIIILFVGYGIYQDSLFKLMITIFLWVLFYFKTQYEELQLQRKFPEYKVYKSKVGRFFPNFDLSLK
ncbi:isoprenylcysteine carboxylmethyltransferase family protein [Flavobacterium sp.]|uniref:methyltransferase family protein n=1 Tax=Flavobacterium sp. TaxID=239 RepID=UPI0025C60A56|nr:isoprenylcysteine carboxylmethyltransferase family protein [Flavobacterium sp.]MBA4153566.1 isoprenylcysteine carboxylmethyltransferase family protein [Flavobacterium sp.]